jgi:hypothetical protein
MPDKGDLGLGAVSSLIGVCEVKAPLQPFIPVSHSLLFAVGAGPPHEERLGKARRLKQISVLCGVSDGVLAALAYVVVVLAARLPVQ